jgi:hypothetical protein
MYEHARLHEQGQTDSPHRSKRQAALATSTGPPPDGILLRVAESPGEQPNFGISAAIGVN